MDHQSKLLLYFSTWAALSVVALILNILNVDWERTSLPDGIILCILLGIVQGSVLELVVQTVVAIFYRGSDQRDKVANFSNLTLLMAYNLLAVSKSDINETFHQMYKAYMGNLSENISIVLISATSDPKLIRHEKNLLKHYRLKIRKQLLREHIRYLQGAENRIDMFRLHFYWKRFSKEYLQRNIYQICLHLIREFMLLHRVSKVLRKCGQYQDLIILSSGIKTAYSYTDNEYYGKLARCPGEPLFHSSDDVNNICGRNFNYTLVLDGDTEVPPTTAYELMAIAAGNPDRGIIQPSITMHVKEDDTLFMHIESLRQRLATPFSEAVGSLLGQCGFFGKALIKNDIYLNHVIGTPDDLKELVPIDVLSHDTFEAAILKPYYALSVTLLEAPCFNYITWDIRERRWNKGEIILAMYFWKNIFGKPMRFLQRILKGKSFVETKMRTPSKFDVASAYIAHSALRMMFMKPLLLLYAILHCWANLYYPSLSLSIILFIVMIFPKFAIINRRNVHLVFIEVLASFLQFTPECVVGCVRIARAFYSLISNNTKWVPQRAVEETFRISNPFVSSFKHLWGYSLSSAVLAVVVQVLTRRFLIVDILLLTMFLLPFCTGCTSISLAAVKSKIRVVRKKLAVLK
ncbi:uncharacterized protein LOC102807443 [Saccoglossus kowalevskii]|uniref:Uncharacterized protein LOC102807443 n=1 Tax=Saccoglossus kowalevskii TaxID=10224 RepID=A0ABM0MC42_SACKO|nr:PREDICTED: uncharacterized protein LOC102807443 [Saccoglossus kowalevskii]